LALQCSNSALMRSCLVCGSLTRNKKYCSYSCSIPDLARIRAEKGAASRPPCPNCGLTVREGHLRFCGKSCFLQYHERARVELWLQTGIAKPEGYGYVRRFILKEQGGRCSICGEPPIWNNKELKFILDHIDGNHQNNCRKNLRLVCPNCDSQLDTYKGRNRGNGRHLRRVKYANGDAY